MERIVEKSDGLKLYQSTDGFSFINGERIAQLVLAFETYGTLNENKSNVILIHHAFSTHSHVASHKKNKNEGWWEHMVGSGKPINTDDFYVICINNLGSCFGSSSPAIIDEETELPYNCNFPVYTFEDVVNSQKQLLDYLEISELHTVIGPSLGGMISLTWAVKYPQMVQRLISISSSARAFPSNNANRSLQREIIMLDPEWNNGNYIKNPVRGLKAARKLGLYTYRSTAEFDSRFHLELTNQNPKRLRTDREEVENYLEYNATKFVSNFDVNCYLYTLQMMDLYDIRNGYGSFKNALSRITADVLVISVTTDKLFIPLQQKEIHEELIQAGVSSEYISHKSAFGHDTFLIETEQMGAYIESFIRKELK